MTETETENANDKLKVWLEAKVETRRNLMKNENT